MSDKTVTAVQRADIYDIAGDAHGHLVVLAPDFRDPTGMGTVPRPVAASDYTGDDSTPGQWTLTFADQVQGNSDRLITSATRRFTLA
jgi:hypothetical protein